MSYLIFFFLVMVVVGFLCVASNPSPYYGALGLVLAAAGGCGVLMGFGGSFISLVLFLIYLGGMLVVFAYSAALATEPYPDSWGSSSVFWVMVLYVGLGSVGAGLCYNGLFEGCSVVDEYHNFSVLRGDLVGVSYLYSFGGGMLITCGWVLLLTLFAILELTRGRSSGSLRAV
uniref:NADH-ubiquinone oxidoreductase chain 6 n=1 Tax=Kaupichthys hyoproroides TaxID=139721 RepID=Q959Y8_KAUHY|nr:NADH dehydrogenase subunit 6 [Kaupichthys hyoproroides]BAB47009.1 NADH dehydrogenase subunit 6 [Kaupichthys hyoproroides]BAI53209.1 NADH dehydrogenase subunit 6 [Kaupichthys hyoproroides]